MTTTGIPSGLSLMGHAVFDVEGAELGEVAGVYLDKSSGRPEWAAVRGVGWGITVLPLAGAAIYEDSLEVPFSRAQVEAAPYRRARPARELSEEEEAELYRHYGQARPQPGGATAASSAIAATTEKQEHRVAQAAGKQGQRVASTVADAGRHVATRATEQGREVVTSATSQAKAMVDTAKERASELAGEALPQARNVLEETRSRLEAQAASGIQRTAESLRSLGDECAALAEGRPQEAPAVSDYVRQGAERLLEAADRVYGLADEVESQGLGGLLEDVGGFARSRPELFLFAMTGVGFVAGRVIRNRRAEDEEPAEGHGQPGRALDPGALDALSRRIWSGEDDDRHPPCARRQQPVRQRS